VGDVAAVSAELAGGADSGPPGFIGFIPVLRRFSSTRSGLVPVPSIQSSSTTTAFVVVGFVRISMISARTAHGQLCAHVK
jgi:hypothetical protein